MPLSLFKGYFVWFSWILSSYILQLNGTPAIPSRSLRKECRLDVDEQEGCYVRPPVGCCCCHYFRSCCFRAACFLKCWPAGIGENEKECGQLFPLEMQRKWVTNSAPNSVQIHRVLLKILNDLRKVRTTCTVYSFAKHFLSRL